MKRINILLILWASIAAKASADRFSAPDTLHRRSTYHEDVPESDDYLDSPDETEPDDNDVSNYDSQDLVFADISESELADNSSQDEVEDYNNNYNREPDALEDDEFLLDLGLFHIWVEPTPEALSRTEAKRVIYDVRDLLDLYMESNFSTIGYKSIYVHGLEDIEFHPISDSSDDKHGRLLSRSTGGGASILHISGMQLKFQNSDSTRPTIIQLRKELSSLVASTFEQCHNDEKRTKLGSIIDLYWSEQRPFRDCEDYIDAQTSALEKEGSDVARFFIAALPVVLIGVLLSLYVYKRKKHSALSSENELKSLDTNGKVKMHTVSTNHQITNDLRNSNHHKILNSNVLFHDRLCPFPLQVPFEISAVSRSSPTEDGNESTSCNEDDEYYLRSRPIYVPMLNRGSSQNMDCLGTSGLDFGVGLSFGGSPTYTRHDYDIEAIRQSEGPEGRYVACESDQEDCSSLSGGSVSSGDSSGEYMSLTIV
jgi:hypothetical protein